MILIDCYTDMIYFSIIFMMTINVYSNSIKDCCDTEFYEFFLFA